MTGIVCLVVLVVLYLMFGWPGVLVGAGGLLAVMISIAWRQLDREDADLIRRAQGRHDRPRF